MPAHLVWNTHNKIYHTQRAIQIRFVPLQSWFSKNNLLVHNSMWTRIPSGTGQKKFFLVQFDMVGLLVGVLSPVILQGVTSGLSLIWESTWNLCDYTFLQIFTTQGHQVTLIRSKVGIRPMLQMTKWISNHECWWKHIYPQTSTAVCHFFF